MDGAAKDLSTNEDVKEFYLGLSTAGARASATSSTTGGASAGWPETLCRPSRIRDRHEHPLRHTRDARPRGARARHPRPAAGTGRAREARAPAFAKSSRKSIRARDLARGAREAARDPQGGAARPAAGGASLRRPCRIGLRRDRTGVRLPRPDLRAGRARAGLVAPRAGALRRGVRRGDLVHNCFSYHFTPAGSMLETGAHALGCAVFPTGRGRPSSRCRRSRTSGPPATSARRRSCASSSRRRTSWVARCLRSPRRSFSGEAFPPSLRDALIARGIHGYQVYATAEPGQHRLRDGGARGPGRRRGCAAEIVRPGTGDPVPDGEVGEVVVTTLSNPDYPLVRFGTGDLSAVLPGRSPCGRTNVRIKGWMGRGRPDDQGQGPVRASLAGRGDRRAAHRDREGPAGGRQSGPERPHDAARRAARGTDGSGRGDRRVDPRRHQASGRGAGPATGELPNDGKVIDDTRTYT